MADAKAPPEGPLENPELAANTIRQQLDRALTSLQGFAKENKEGAQKVIDQIHATFQEKSGELQKMKEDVSAQLKTKYTEVANFAKNKMGLTDIPLTVEDLQKKFNQNIVSFSKNPLGNVGGFFKETFNKIPIPNWFKNMTGLGTSGEIAESIGRMGKRLYFNFLLGVDKMVPAFMAPLFGGTIENARESLIDMDAEDGLKAALKELQKTERFKILNMPWDAGVWAEWRQEFKKLPANSSARTFVKDRVMAHMSSLPADQKLEATYAMKNIKISVAPTVAPVAPESVPGNLAAYGLPTMQNGVEKEITDGISYKNYATDPTANITIKRDEIVRGSDKYKVDLKGDVKVFFKPVLIENHLRESKVIYKSSSGAREITIQTIGPLKLDESPAMVIDISKKTIL